MGINAEQEYTTAYFLNILRLTSLPFIHAVWCGIAGYFISFASLYPKYRIALSFLAIAIPAVLHGIYDTFCGTLLGILIALPTMFVTVILLNAYLKQGANYQSKLRN
jgi:RsiW-degrading membrane proteinase PrsW (M82 family)